MLPLRERRALDRVPDSRDQTVGYLPLAALSSEAEVRARVEVVRIRDMRNPTKRLSASVISTAAPADLSRAFGTDAAPRVPCCFRVHTTIPSFVLWGGRSQISSQQRTVLLRAGVHLELCRDIQYLPSCVYPSGSVQRKLQRL